jgi:hypothetical protein
VNSACFIARDVVLRLAQQHVFDGSMKVSDIARVGQRVTEHPKAATGGQVKSGH